jgi:hypothetical protein
MSSPRSSNWIVSSLHDTDEDEQQQQSTTTPETKIPTRLILHLDINETILLGDDAGGDTRHDSIQKMIAKSAFVEMTTTTTTEEEEEENNNDKTRNEQTSAMEPTKWWDGQVIGQETTMPPLYTGWDWPTNCCPYYRTSYKKYSKRFVEEYHGRIYRPVLERCEEQLSKSHSNHILPAFYETLYQLLKSTEAEETSVSTTTETPSSVLPFTIVFRTFGSDVTEIAQLITNFARGNHPDYGDVNCPQLCLGEQNLYQGRWKQTSDGGIVYQLWNTDETELVASGDQEILQLLERVSICGIRDDYNHWKRNNWDPTAGKPIWVPWYDSQNNSAPYDHHVIFDDNIHNLAHDGIVCVRQQQQRRHDGTFVTVDGTTMHTLYQGIHMIRVPTIEPVLNPHWFVEQINNARDKLQQRLLKQRRQQQQQQQQ